MGIKINGVRLQEKEINKKECPHCTLLVAETNWQNHVNECDYNPNKIK
jgi:hypothetical protein